MPQAFSYDVFISHSSKDEAAVLDLASRLRQDGLRVWLDDWVISPGDLISLKIEEGLEQSRTLLLIMSKNAFMSEWVGLERHTALFRDPSNTQRRFIPLLLEDCEVKDILRQFAYVDWRNRSEQQYARLLDACHVSARKSAHGFAGRHNATPSCILKGHKVRVLSLSVTPGGRYAACRLGDGSVRLWDVLKQTSLESLDPKDGWPGLTITSDATRVLLCGQDGSVQIWDLRSHRCIAELRGHTAPVLAMQRCER